MNAARSLCFVLALLVSGFPVAAQSVLFDASHRENAGNADWVIDADTFDLNQAHFPCGGGDFENESNAQRFPTPAASGITASTPETYWTGAISAFAVDLVKLGYQVESLPVSGAITYGDAGNPQDLSNYDVFVLPEPNAPFDPTETQAIRDFVAAGGGLFLITDHQTSDRDCDGFDSPHIGNDLMGVVISGGVITDYGLFGIVFNVQEIAGQTSADYWFTDAVDDNVTTAPGDPIIDGPYGSGAGGLGFFGATAMTIDLSTNPTVRGHVWKTDAGSQGNTRVTFATAEYMAGRIACIGDSSPADDGTGDPGDNLYFGWDQASGGVNNREIHLNAVAWLAGPDTVAPVITSGPVATAFDCSARIDWTTDEPADSTVEYGPTMAYGFMETDPALTTQHGVILGGLTPDASYHYVAGSTDGSGNGPTTSGDMTFATGPDAPPAIVAGPVVTNLGGSSATVVWTTDEPASSVVHYGTSPAYGDTEADPALTTDHSVLITGLSPSTSYHFSVESTDGCGNGPTSSADDTFTTSPAQIDISGWELLQFSSSQSYVFPPGTTLPANGYLVLARDASQAAFEAEWGPLPPGTVFVNSGGTFPFINGGESFELRDVASATVDGVTISMSSGTTIQRTNPGDPPGHPASWIVAGFVAGSPGSGAGAGSQAGVVINEASDAGDFENEFVELFYDAVPMGPDTTPPAAVGDLVAVPLSDSVVRVSFTAPGDDGNTGTATSYDLRYAPAPILSEASFLTATPLSGEPAPSAAGSPEAWEITGLAPETTYYLAVVTADEAGNESPVSVSVGATTGPPGSGGGDPPADHLVISEIQTRGAVNQNDEFVELHNPTDAPVALGGLSVQYKSASGSTFLRVDLPSTSIAPGGYFLLTRPPGEYGGAVPGDATHGTFLMSGSGGHVFLVAGNSNLSSCTAGAILDKVGYGTANCPESVAAPAHSAGDSLQRGPGGGCGSGADSDDNLADFFAGVPGPQNSLSVEAPCVDLGNVGASLFVGGAGPGELRWAAALGAASFKVRRASSADFMVTHPVPDDTHLLAETVATGHVDAAVPGVGAVFYYFVNAVGGGGLESVD